MSDVNPSRRVAILAPMHPELAPLVRPLSLRRPSAGAGGLRRGALGATEVVAAVTGIGPRAAHAAAARLLEAVACDRVVVVGVAGGIGPSLAVGDLVVPERVLDLATGSELSPTPLGPRPPRGTLATSDRLLEDPREAARLAARGVVAVDMETAAIGAVCDARRCPWSVFRAISDRADDGSTDRAILELAGADGAPDLGAVARLLWAQPRRLPQLLRLARGLRAATRAAAAAALAALAADR